MKSLIKLTESDLVELGVLDWGYTEESVPVSVKHFEQWVNQGYSAPLGYLADYRKDLRRDLKKVYPQFRSALVFLFGYQETKRWMLEEKRFEVAGYALGFGGADYHYELKHRLQMIGDKLKVDSPGLDYFISLDAEPVLERDLAYRSGLGWFGKNSMLINRLHGSYFLIGSLLLDQTLPIQSSPIDNDHCGHCLACVEACPTLAINPETRTLITQQCLSTYTIEVFKEAEAPVGYEKSRGEIFGCDICQDVCPWNQKPLARVESKLNLLPQWQFLKNWFYLWGGEKFKNYLLTLSNRAFRKQLLGTAFARPGRQGWLKNLKARIHHFQSK